MSVVEQEPIEIVPQSPENKSFIPRLIGGLAFPEEVNSQYAYLARGSEQLVIDRYAYPFEVTAIPIEPHAE